MFIRYKKVAIIITKGHKMEIGIVFSLSEERVRKSKLMPVKKYNNIHLGSTKTSLKREEVTIEEKKAAKSIAVLHKRFSIVICIFLFI